MAHSKHEHEHLCVADLIDDPVVPRSDPPFAGTTHELRRSGRPRVLGQEFEHALNPTADVRGELLQLPRRRGRELDPVGQLRPRSALTCSQGIGVSPVACISARAASAARMSAMSSASSRMRSRSSASMTAATRRPRRVT